MERIFLTLAALRSMAAPLLAAVVFLTVAILGRMLGMVLDGSDPQATQAAVVEMVFLAICVFAYRTLRADGGNQPE